MKVTTAQDIDVLSFGYGRNLFDEENGEHRRLRECAEKVRSLHMVVFTLRSEGFAPLTAGGLTVHPTASKMKLLYLFDALRIGLRILTAPGRSWVVTTQDPFETGLIGLIVSWWRNVPLNVQEHGDFYSRPYWRKDTLGNRIRYWAGICVLRHADTVRIVSGRIGKALEGHGVRREVLIKLPVRTELPKEGIPAVDSLKLRYPDASLIVLTMARLVTQKNLPLLIRAFAELLRTEPKARLVIVGRGPLEGSLKRLVESLHIRESVAFLGWTESPEAYMRTADIYALSSDWEGWGRVVIESMGAGVSVVTTDVGCVGEVFKHKEHGLVVSPRDTDGFVRALVELAQDPMLRNTYGEQGKRDAEAWQTSKEDYVKAWADVFLKTVQKAD